MDIEQPHVEDLDDSTQISRRGLLVTGGLAAAGLTALGGPAAALAAGRASSIKVAVVTHGDTGSFWSVFKKGVDQAAKDLKGRGVSVTQVYANNDVAKQVSGINAANNEILVETLALNYQYFKYYDPASIALDAADALKGSISASL